MLGARRALEGMGGGNTHRTERNVWAGLSVAWMVNPSWGQRQDRDVGHTLPSMQGRRGFLPAGSVHSHRRIKSAPKRLILLRALLWGPWKHVLETGTIQPWAFPLPLSPPTPTQSPIPNSSQNCADQTCWSSLLTFWPSELHLALDPSSAPRLWEPLWNMLLWQHLLTLSVPPFLAFRRYGRMKYTPLKDIHILISWTCEYYPIWKQFCRYN